MDKDSIWYDPNSRYNNVNNENIIFLTPRQLQEMDIGIDMNAYREDEMDDIFPVLVDTLREMITETTIGGVDNGSEISIKVDGSELCTAHIVLDINGKLCKLETEEWDILSNLKGLPVEKQVKTFQRLISQRKITLDDLAAVDIDNEVYKKLVINEAEGFEVWKEKIHKLDAIIEEQEKSERFKKLKKAVINSL